MSGALCPGSFDPVTNGHLDVFTRAAQQFDDLLITVVVNPNKSGLFTIAERIDMIGEATAHLTGVRIESWQGLLVDFAQQQSINAIVKGLRGPADFEYELQMAQLNRKLTGVDTLFLATNPEFGFVSSSYVKEIAKYGGDVRDMVPPSVHQRLLDRLAERA